MPTMGFEERLVGTPVSNPRRMIQWLLDAAGVGRMAVGLLGIQGCEERNMAVDFGLVISLGGTESLPDDNRRFLGALAPPFTTFWVEDHFQFGERPLLECWTALSVYGTEFPSLKMGTIVLSQSYRNPAMLAKMAAALQWLSGGRLILGIGAGWKEDEYRAYGYPFPKPADRIHQLDEAVQIIRKMWTEMPATFEGRFYQIKDAICSPRPDPIPPIMIGGGGEQLTLRVAAKRADWWNIGFRPFQEYSHKVDVLKSHCAHLGRDFNSIKLTYYARVSVSKDPNAVQRGERVVAGTPDEVAQSLQLFIDLGVSHFMVGFNDFPDLAGLELFQNEVIPRLRLGS
jgi:alkanesulfonate monooxygenase SsuD/methylene tetrahydromethanopterin reductase-like flavin-dependent oxidoreductase (luciferase family)